MSILVERIRNGDKKAVLEFYESYASKIRRYLKKRLQRNDEVNKLLNEVFFDVIDTLPFYETKNDLQTWLYKIAQNKLTDFYRKNKIKSILLSQIPFLQIVSDEIHQTQFQSKKNEIRDGIESALRSLPDRYREILKLRYEEKIPIKQIALILNLSFKATESLLFRARQSFRLAYAQSINSEYADEFKA